MNIETLYSWRLPFCAEDQLLSKEFDVNKRQRQAEYYKTLYEKEDSSPLAGHSDYHNTKRKANRFNTNGIVALTGYDQPIVTQICDISAGGVSFLHDNEIEINNCPIQMDILIFEILTDFEYLINQVNGYVKSKKLVVDPKSKTSTWRFSVEFIDLDSSKQNLLKILFGLIQTKNIQLPDDSCQKVSYDS